MVSELFRAKLANIFKTSSVLAAKAFRLAQERINLENKLAITKQKLLSSQSGGNFKEVLKQYKEYSYVLQKIFYDEFYSVEDLAIITMRETRSVENNAKFNIKTTSQKEKDIHNLMSSF